MTEPSQDVVQSLAETIAREIASRQPRDGGPATVDFADLSATYNGKFTLAIKYDTTTYTLTVTIPTGSGGTYDFLLTALKDGSQNPETIAEFKYTAPDNWSVTAGLPQPITWGNLTLETVSLNISATPGA
jgi:hypothetical protein